MDFGGLFGTAQNSSSFHLSSLLLSLCSKYICFSFFFFLQRGEVAPAVYKNEGVSMKEGSKKRTKPWPLV